MNRLVVLTVIGTRPEAIKMAPVINKLKEFPQIKSYVCVTAQHREMLDQVLSLFDIVPDYDLNLMRPDQTPTQLIARILLEMDPLLREVEPQWVLVQGDTTTVMATTIAARHLKIKVGHVEAGLRTGDFLNPFPEEMNRVVTDSISNLFFAPTKNAQNNLLREGVAKNSIVVTGNTVIDALFNIAERPWKPKSDSPIYRWSQEQNHVDDRKLILVTAHRRENFGRPLRNICFALKEIARMNGDKLEIVFPVHLNPNVSKLVKQELEGISNITLIPPLDYLSLVHLMKRSKLILTDSGGIQEEAPSLGVPVLVLREVTERPEGVEAGVVKVVGTDPNSIIQETENLLNNNEAYRAMAQSKNPYGDGQAAIRIVNSLLEDAKNGW